MITIRVVGGAIRRDGKILAARRGDTMAMAGKWEFPGGKVESGETPEECLARELKEELGIEVTVGSFVATGFAAIDGSRTVKLDVYRCEWTGGELTLREHSEVAWLTPAELGGYDWADADWPAVVALGGHPVSYSQRFAVSKTGDADAGNEAGHDTGQHAGHDKQA